MKRVKADIGLTERPRVLRAVASARTALDRRLRAIPGMRYVLAACGIVTPFGWLVIASAIAGLVVAGVVGWAEAFALAIACVALLVIAIVLVAAPSPYRVSLRLPQERVTAGQTALGDLPPRRLRGHRAAHRRRRRRVRHPGRALSPDVGRVLLRRDPPPRRHRDRPGPHRAL